MLLNCGVGEDTWETLGMQGGHVSQPYRKSTINSRWKDWCWSFNTLATWCEEATYWKWSWCWERSKAKGEGGSRGWDGWMASVDLLDMNLSKLLEAVKNRDWNTVVHGVAKSQTWLSHWTTTTQSRLPAVKPASVCCFLFLSLSLLRIL